MRAEKVLDKAQVHGAPNMQQYQGMPGPKTGVHPSYRTLACGDGVTMGVSSFAT